jgi:hypothetical protein
MPQETLDAACSFLQQQSDHILYTVTSSSSSKNWSKYRVTPPLQKAIERIVFQHKLLLLPNKTILDTVQPVEQWTLKQPTKNGGCACCDEEPPDDDEEEADTFGRKMTNPAEEMTVASQSSSSSNNRKTTTMKTTRAFGYVDGKTKFAFDPTQFA